MPSRAVEVVHAMLWTGADFMLCLLYDMKSLTNPLCASLNSDKSN
jgi:hypothetical protein